MHMENDVLATRTEVVVNNSSAINNTVVDHEPQRDTLANLHRRMGHINYRALIAFAKTPDAGIELTSLEQPQCFECFQGKKRETSSHSPIPARTRRSTSSVE